MRVLSGIQPSGDLHLGNYFGALVQHIAASKVAKDSEALFFIADYHALTTVHDKDKLVKSVNAVAATYIALGLDTEKAIFFRQSDVPEVQELTWLLGCCTGMGLLQRSHSYKEKVEKGLPASVGLFSYPLLMSADILLYDSTIVPVGQDQVQHVEIAQNCATHFNETFGAKILTRPEFQLSPTPKIPGTDGEKMSKSYGNTIGIFDEGKVLKKAIAGIKTDSRPPEEPKDPDGVLLFQILKLFLSPDEISGYEADLKRGGLYGVGYGKMKEELVQKIDDTFGPVRARYAELMVKPELMEPILEAGAAKARKIAQATLARCYEAVGMPNAVKRLKKNAL